LFILVLREVRMNALIYVAWRAAAPITAAERVRCRAEAARRGLRVIGEYADHDDPRGWRDRRGLMEVRGLVCSGVVDVILLPGQRALDGRWVLDTELAEELAYFGVRIDVIREEE
jgi:hypothetical protein